MKSAAEVKGCDGLLVALADSSGGGGEEEGGAAGAVLVLVVGWGVGTRSRSWSFDFLS